MSETEKNKGGRPRVDALPITLRLPPDLLAGVDGYIAHEQNEVGGKPLSRPEAVRHALKDWLTGHGYMRHREDPEGAN
ncbi:ribbon-helix-helix domain-containing protein [Methylobacterium radiotolerans]|uniref:ribbon-helix-helix domain-containing protein n=1 Tax=Methylobacterium radiotolerans TaxID=31998 RepID=UPI0015F67C22|nr:ribbon-helix-helix domain-containing protein [Methylobacterium radiotolerans]